MPTVSGSMKLTTGFDKPVLSFVEGLRTNGWHIEGLRASACLVARIDDETAFMSFAIGAPPSPLSSPPTRGEKNRGEGETPDRAIDFS
jgi:hypothetical protein